MLGLSHNTRGQACHSLSVCLSFDMSCSLCLQLPKYTAVSNWTAGVNCDKGTEQAGLSLLRAALSTWKLSCCVRRSEQDRQETDSCTVRQTGQVTGSGKVTDCCGSADSVCRTLWWQAENTADTQTGPGGNTSTLFYVLYLREAWYYVIYTYYYALYLR